VVIEHQADIHPVDVIGAEDGDVLRPDVAEQIQVLPDGIRRAPDAAATDYTAIR
jgi:hypothetical protein